MLVSEDDTTPSQLPNCVKNHLGRALRQVFSCIRNQITPRVVLREEQGSSYCDTPAEGRDCPKSRCTVHRYVVSSRFLTALSELTLFRIYGVADVLA